MITPRTVKTCKRQTSYGVSIKRDDRRYGECFSSTVLIVLSFKVNHCNYVYFSNINAAANGVMLKKGHLNLNG